MGELIAQYEENMRNFCEGYVELEDREELLQAKVDEEFEAMSYIKGESDSIMREVEEESQQMIREGERYVKPEGPPSLVRLSFALQELYSRKVSHTLLHHELTQVQAVLKQSNEQAIKSREREIKKVQQNRTH